MSFLFKDFQSHQGMSLVAFFLPKTLPCSGNEAMARSGPFCFQGDSMLYNLLKLSHVLSILVWVGGMVFAHFFLRPAVAALEPPQRLRLMHQVLGRFFRVVLILSTWAVISGLTLVGLAASAQAGSGGAFHMPLAWTVMATLGLVMWGIFGHIRFALFKRLGRGVEAADWPAAGAALNAIRQWVSVNMALGIAIVAVTLLG
jgi:uncharacterized membrane protein